MAAPWQILAFSLSPEEYRKLFVQVLWAAGSIAGGFVLLALMLAWLKKRRQGLPSERLASSDRLANYRILYEQGELTAEEYARIRSRLAQRLKREADVKTAPPPEPKESESPVSSEGITLLGPGEDVEEPPPPQPPAPEGPTP